MNEIDFLTVSALLLPVAFLSGWWLARSKKSNSNRELNSSINPEYFKGLNYVLNEQPDKAIEVFVRMLEVDSETVETHLALGNLFRRRGEVDRAIRIHQNLIARPNLSQEQKALALLELALDYMRSGLLDRAEGLFKQLVELDKYSLQACRHLLDIYQQEKDWENAIFFAKKLEASSNGTFDPLIAQFYCELAEDHITQKEDKEAREKLRKALNKDPACVRASILEGTLLKKDGKLKSALKAYKRVEKQDVEYLPEVIESVLECYQKLEQPKAALEFLQHSQEKHSGTDSMLLLTELIIEQQGEEEGINYIAQQLRDRPTVRGVDRLLKYSLRNIQGEDRSRLKTIKELTESLLENRPAYKCQQCGFKAKQLHWQCPSCKNWTTLKPTAGVKSE
ncbi:MAG: lipopolysaccharide assembly protein LapB [Gammaproteobacteria bacterium]|nr:lipopolysaccharide assembly protein LapB [Gammaproteobacteria bacterium]